jgi:flagellar biosynthesis anti-sigma factor FlgM
MRIDPRYNKPVNSEKIESKKVEHTAAGEAAKAKKVVNLSSDPLLVNKAKEQITAHESPASGKVSSLKQDIDSGNYKVDEEKLAQIMEKLL